MPGKITAKQQQILDYIKEEILRKGYPPTVREICEKVGLRSTSSVHSHLATLEENGYIRRDPTKPRAIEIIDDEFGLARREMSNIPVVGRVAAGEPLLAVENIEDYFALPTEFLPNNETFILKIHGESMINVGFYENDYIIVERTSAVSNGDIVVALIDDSATVKRFYKEDGNVCCEDLDSTNGIKINGVKLNGKKNKKAVLKEGDCIKIGLEEFYFKED